MNIETGVFTTVTSGYYIVTYSGSVKVLAGDYVLMYLYHNGVKVEESEIETTMQMHVGSGDDWIREQASKTVVSIACL